MLRTATLQANLPSQNEMDRLEEARAQSLQHGEPNDRLDNYDDMRVYLELARGGQRLVFDGCEPTSYVGVAKGRLVFAVMICDDVPEWLGRVFGLDAEQAQEDGEMPGSNEAVYIIAPVAPGERCDVVLAMLVDDEPGGWDIETIWPLTEQELLSLFEALGM